jgi:hypothetical protein
MKVEHKYINELQFVPYQIIINVDSLEEHKELYQDLRKVEVNFSGRYGFGRTPRWFTTLIDFVYTSHKLR